MQQVILRACLIAYPREFRALYGEELAEVVRRRYRHERHRCGRWRGLAYGSSALVDLMAAGLRVRLAARRAEAGERAGSAVRGASAADAGRRGGTGGGPAGGPGSGGRPRRVITTLDRAAHDLRLAFRTLLARPVFTAVVVATLALGIGANTLIFSVAYSVLLQPLPYAEPDRLVGVYRANARITGANPSAERLAGMYAVPYPLFLDWQELSPVFSDVGAYLTDSATLTGFDEPVRLAAVRGTSGVFTALGTRALIGRTLIPQDDEVGAPPVVVLSHASWQGRFGGDPGIIGTQITLDGKRHTIVGVMPADFYFPDASQDLWASFGDAQKQTTYRAGGNLQVIARLVPGADLERARAEMDAVARRIAAVHPEEEDDRVIVLPRMELAVAASRGALLVFVGAVGLVLLIACANVAGLLLVRAMDRRKELAVRAALGAGKGRLVFQMLNESLLLSLAGGSVGAAIALFGLEPFAASFPGGLARSSEIVVNGRLLLVALAFSVATALLIGVLPALRSARTSLGDALSGGDRTVAGSRARNRAQATLVVAQVALAFALLVGAGLLAKSFLRLVAVDYGFEADNRLVMSVELPEPYRSSPEKTRIFYEELAERLSALPGVETVGSASQLPFIGGSSWPPVQVETADGLVDAGIHAVSAMPEYFEAMGVPLRAGRPLTREDREGSAPVVVINEMMARRFWPDENPIGRRISLEGYILDRDDIERVWLTVVGVMGDFRYAHEAPPYVTYWFPFAEYPYFYQTLVIKASSDPAALIAPARAALRQMDPDIPALIGRYDEIIAHAPGVMAPRFGAVATGLLALIAALLALIGIYGVLASAVAQRTHEIGIRVALGARKGTLVRGVLRRAVVLAGIGLVLGLGVAFAGARVLDSVLFEISATDPLTLAQMAALVLAAALAAGYLPARRATRIDPVEALKRE